MDARDGVNVGFALQKLSLGKYTILSSPLLALTIMTADRASLTTTMIGEHEAKTTTMDDHGHDHGQRRITTIRGLPPWSTTYHQP